jgi:hypothetical protein
MAFADTWPEEEELLENNNREFMAEQWELFQKNRTGQSRTP